MKWIQTTFDSVEIYEPIDPTKIYTVEELERFSVDTALRVAAFKYARTLHLQQRRDINGQPCLAMYDRISDTLFVKYEDVNV